MLPQENMQQQHNMFSTSVEKEQGYAMVKLIHACSTKHARDQELVRCHQSCCAAVFLIQSTAYGRYVVLRNKLQSDYIL